MVWGSVALLAASIALFAEYWRDPSRFLLTSSSSTTNPSSAAQNPIDPSTLPPQEDRAIGMDIDNLPLLLGEIGDFNAPSEALENTNVTSEVPSGVAGPNADAQSRNRLSPPDIETILYPDSRTQGSNSPRPFQAFALDGPNFSWMNNNSSRPSNGDSNPSSMNFGFGLPAGLDGSSTSSQDNSASSRNALQDAMTLYGASSSERTSSSASNGQSSETSTPSSSPESNPSQISQFSAPLPGQALPNQGQPGRQLGQQPGQLGSQQFFMQTSPLPGTTGYTPPASLQVPSTPGTPTNFGSPQGFPSQGFPQAPQMLPPTVPQAIPMQPNFGQSAFPNSNQNFGLPNQSSQMPGVPTQQFQPQQAQPQAPPQRLPGSRIGGGEINTFANP